jgi:hypothetical protein
MTADHTPATPRPKPTSTPILVRTLVWGGAVTGALLVVGAIVGFLTAGGSGLASALVGVLLAAVFLAITSLSILIANRWYGDALYVPIFFGLVLGGWILKFVVFFVALLVLRGQPWVTPVVLFLAIVAGIVASLVVDVVVLLRTRLPYASDVSLPGDESGDDDIREQQTDASPHA